MATSFVTVSEVTSSPKPTSTGYPEAFIGYSSYSELNGYTYWFCEGKVWRTFGNYAVCCPPDPNTQCFVPTACSGENTLVGPRSDVVETCEGSGPSASCVVGTIFDRAQDGSTASPVTNVGCWPHWTGGSWTATRTVMLTTGSGAAVRTVSTLIPPPTSSATPNSIATSFRPTVIPDPAATTSTAAAQGSSGLSTGAKAGIGVGAAALGLSFLCIMAFLILRYRKRSHQATASPHGSDTLGLQTSQNTWPTSPVAYTHGLYEVAGDERRHSELEAQSPSHEVAASRDGVGTAGSSSNARGPVPSRAGTTGRSSHSGSLRSSATAQRSAAAQGTQTIDEDAESFISAVEENPEASQH